jgi:hypothetical protein
MGGKNVGTPYLSDSLLQKALAADRALEEKRYRAWALEELAPHLSEPLQTEALREALAAARATEDVYSRTSTLAGLIPHLEHLPSATLYPLWCETLHVRALRTRRDLLLDIQALSPVISALGGKEALAATAQAIIEIGKWFP